MLWSNHINVISRKISRNIWLLSQIGKYLPITHMVTYYKSYIQPHIDYCNIIWASTSKANLKRIEILQKRACRIIMNYNCDSALQAMADLNIMTIYERIFLRKAKFMYKVSSESTPLYIKDLFKKRNQGDETMPFLRSTASNNFLLPKPNIELYRNSLSFSGPVIWNCLPMYVKASTSTDIFHKTCVKWMNGGSTGP